MSIDLSLNSVRPIRTAALLPAISSVLMELLGLTFYPKLTLMQLEEGTQHHPVTDEIGSDQSPTLVVAIEDENGSAILTSVGDQMSVTAGGWRSNLEFALVAAVAIVLAREFGVDIWDDRLVFGEQHSATAEERLARLRGNGPHDDYHKAALKIKWGPAGGGHDY